MTGAAGLQGSHLCERLWELGHTVLGIDNYSRGSFRADYIQEDDLRYGASKALFFDHFDVVFHLAAQVWGVAVTRSHNHDMLQHNLQVDGNVFRWAVEAGIKRLVYPSSACVYPQEFQDRPDSILREDMAWGGMKSPSWMGQYVGPNPESGYGWSKLLGEVQVKYLPMETVVFRLFNVYGEGENYGAGSHVIPELVRKTLLAPPGGELLVYGDGSAGRTFLHVEDAVSAYIAALKCEPGTTMNIGDPKPIRIKELAERIVAMDGRGVRPVYDATKPEGVKGRTADITLAEKVLGWSPGISLDEGLRRVYTSIKEKMEEKIIWLPR